jgi:hypothetical protein
VEAACAGPNCIFIEFNLVPSQSVKVEDPKVVQIADALPSKHQKVGKFDLSNVVGSLPRSRFIFFWGYFYPFLGFPVEHVDGIESLLVGSSASEDDYLLIDSIVVHGAVGAVGRDVSGGGDLFPFLVECVVGPDVVHIIGV